MKNHYQILSLDPKCSTSEIRKKAKELLEKINNTTGTKEQKNNLKKQMYESYKFLTDYHKRKSLDEYLDDINKNKISNYNIISQPNEINLDDDEENSFFGGLIDNIFESILPFNNPQIRIMKMNEPSENQNFFSKSVISTFKSDKNGNLIGDVHEVINDNGKKSEKKYKDVPMNSPSNKFLFDYSGKKKDEKK